MKDRSPRFDVVAFDIDQAAVTGRHQYGDTTGARGLSQYHFDIQRVAFFDNDVKAVEELVDGFRRGPGCNEVHGQVGIQLRDPARRNHRLVEANVEDADRHAIQVRQLNFVEIGQPQCATGTFGGKGVCDRMAGAESDDADP